MNADQFNGLFPIGTPVFAYPGALPEDAADAERLVTRTCSKAKVLGGHTAVVWVKGHGACIALTHIDVIGEAEFKAALLEEAVAQQGALPMPVGPVASRMSPQREDEARAAALREGADAILQSSHGEPMRDAYNAKMQAVGLLRRMAAGKPEEPVTPAEAATEYGIRIPGGRVLLDGNTRDRADQMQRLARCQGKAMWPDAILVQRSVSYGEWTETTS